MSLEEALLSVWRQVMVENAKAVTLDEKNYPVRRTSRSKLREVDFKFEDRALRGVEQNPDTPFALGQACPGRQEGDAVSRAAPLRGRRGRWKGHFLSLHAIGKELV